MSFKKLGLCMVAITSSLVLLTGSPAGFMTMTASAKTLEELQQEASEINARLKKDQNDQQDKQAELDDLNEKISNIKEQIQAYADQIKAKNAEIDALNQQISDKEAELDQRQADLQEQFTMLRERLNAVAKSGNVTTLQMLTDSDSYVDYLIKTKMMERISENDQKLMDEIEAEIESINGERENLENQKQSKQEEESSVQAMKNEKTSKSAELESDYAQLTSEKNQLDTAVSNDKSDQAAKTAEIAAKEKELQNATSGKSVAGKYKGGTMFWPVPTVHNISSGYGYRWGTLHKGVDISEGEVPIYGEDIVAAADGVVIYVNDSSTWGGGYGYHVIIDHGADSNGNRITTLYAHCSAIDVSVGQRVVGGQTVIAQAGATGDVTGPHLHFEVRVNGIAVDPIKNGYLSLN